MVSKDAEIQARQDSEIERLRAENERISQTENGHWRMAYLKQEAEIDRLRRLLGMSYERSVHSHERLLALIEQYKVALEQARSEWWQPIANAPFESAKRFLLCHHNGIPFLGFRVLEDGPWIGLNCGVRLVEFPPHYWMELPKAPHDAPSN